MKQQANRHVVTAFIGNEQKLEFDLESFGKDQVLFGRNPSNDIVLPSEVVSSHHGWFARVNGKWAIYDYNSTNGTWYQERRVQSLEMSDGDAFYIGSDANAHRVILCYFVQAGTNAYKTYRLEPEGQVLIGRSPQCQIVLHHMSISRTHCRIVSAKGKHYLEDCNSTNGVWLNGSRLTGRKQLKNADRIAISDTQLIFSDHLLYYRSKQDGMGVTAVHMSKLVGRGRKHKCINDDVTLSIDPGEFVAIVGGSGAGKSTLLNCLSGYTRISRGQVMINGEELASNYDNLKCLIGYVPQQDIVYENLSLRRMLQYTARLRMPADTGREEIRERIRQVIEMIELTGHEDTPIRSLSGGQRKRASIAVELLADPKLFFLDEPTSGLDPGTERSLMESLKQMTKKNKTVILVTHNTLNLHLCSKVVFMGYGGRLCFSGSPDEALRFFQTDNFVEVYNLIGQDPAGWAERFKQSGQNGEEEGPEPPPPPRRREKRKAKGFAGLRQFSVLSARYLELICRDLNRTLLLLLMAPGLGCLLSLAFSSTFPFESSKDTTSFLFAMSCCAFWVGLFNSIQEICKERVIFQRERMAVLKLIPYMASKTAVLCALCALQSLTLTAAVRLLAGCPEYGAIFTGAPFLEMLLTTFFTMLSAMALGLLVSAVAGNADRAVTMAPILLVPQILFSGVACELGSFGKRISQIVSCKWACVAYCATADVNHLPAAITVDLMGSREAEDPITVSMEYASDLAAGLNPVGRSWLILTAFAAVCIAGGLLYLKFGKRDTL